MPFFITLFVLISVVFAVLAWRMDRKHKVTVDSGYMAANLDKEIAQSVFGDDRWDKPPSGGAFGP
jgi:hypothetical protein